MAEHQDVVQQIGPQQIYGMEFVLYRPLTLCSVLDTGEQCNDSEPVQCWGMHDSTTTTKTKTCGLFASDEDYRRLKPCPHWRL